MNRPRKPGESYTRYKLHLKIAEKMRKAYMKGSLIWNSWRDGTCRGGVR